MPKKAPYGLLGEKRQGDELSALLLVVITGAMAAKIMLMMSMTTIISANVNPLKPLLERLKLPPPRLYN